MKNQQCLYGDGHTSTGKRHAGGQEVLRASWTAANAIEPNKIAWQISLHTPLSTLSPIKHHMKLPVRPHKIKNPTNRHVTPFPLQAPTLNRTLERPSIITTASATTTTICTDEMERMSHRQCVAEPLFTRTAGTVRHNSDFHSLLDGTLASSSVNATGCFLAPWLAANREHPLLPDVYWGRTRASNGLFFLPTGSFWSFYQPSLSAVCSDRAIGSVRRQPSNHCTHTELDHRRGVVTCQGTYQGLVCVSLGRYAPCSKTVYSQTRCDLKFGGLAYVPN